MNKKAQVATVVAILLGIFLVVVTAIKFDWVGMVVRGDKIINFGNTEDNVKPENDSSNGEEEIIEDDEENNPEGGTIYLSCTKTNTSNDISIVDSYNYSFINNKLLNSEENVLISYSLPESKANFDELIKPYSDLVVNYTGNKTVTATEQLVENNYSYYELISYDSQTFDTDLSNAIFNINSTFDEVNNYYKELGYTCTQS